MVFEAELFGSHLNRIGLSWKLSDIVGVTFASR
jgi:hypothetical protein